MMLDDSERAFGQLPARVTEVLSQPLKVNDSFMQVARRFAHLPGTVALVSGGSSDCARYNILGVLPWLTLQGSASSSTIDWQGGTASIELDPLTALQSLLRRYTLPSGGVPQPIVAGLLGYFSYDLKECLEVLPRTSVDDLSLPQLYMTAPSVILVEDRVENCTTIHVPVLAGKKEDAQRRLAEFLELLGQPPVERNNVVRGGGFASGFTRPEYMAAVDAIRDYIVRGHVYQVNMSQRFESTFEGDAFELFANLFGKNPAPFFAFVNAGDHQIVSTSPERFVLQEGRSVETRPIKGTRPRGKTAEEDSAMRHELLSSTKDQAELSMIVDLLRNDIGKVCAAGSVHVSEHKRIEGYKNVFHLVSIVRGTLDADKDAVDLIRATFPGGSITGCPKIRSMEIIDELEPVRRHIYTGSIGYVSFHDTMDLSIAIRTATITRGRILFSVGGGVVYDSDPGSEFEETLHKGRTLMTALDLTPPSQASQSIAWHNGIFKPKSDVRVSVDDEGFLYGYGIFETIRVERGVPFRLEDHVRRFSESWRYCFGTTPPDITWRDVISEVVARSGLAGRVAAVKILATAGEPGRRLLDMTMLVTAREYAPRRAGLEQTGLHLAIYPKSRHTHLSDHKTMNYMFYKMAGQWAKGQKADEALILNRDGSVSETNTANLFCVSAGKILLPKSEHALPGTMEQAACKLLADWGRLVERRPLSVDELKAADQVFVTNALMGAIPVNRIDDHTMNQDREELCSRLNDALFQRT